MRPSTVSQTGVGSSAWCPLDSYTAGDNTGVYAKLTGTATYSVEVTPDDVFNATVTPTAYPCDITALTAASTSQSGTLVKGAKAIRVTLASGTGTVAMTVVVSSVQ